MVEQCRSKGIAMALDLFSQSDSKLDRWFVDLGRADIAPSIAGLVLVDGYNPTGRPPEEVATIEKARSYNAHSVFFEAGRNGRAPVAQAFIFVSKDGRDDEAFADLHKRLWSWGGVPSSTDERPVKFNFSAAHTILILSLQRASRSVSLSSFSISLRTSPQQKHGGTLNEFAMVRFGTILRRAG